MVRRPLMLLGLVAAFTVSSMAVSPAAGAAALGPSITRRVALAPPDAAATAFGAALSIKANRLVASAQLGGHPLVYVFNRSSNGAWTHSGTIHPGAGASDQWATSLAVAGNTIAIADPGVVTAVERYGAVHIYEVVGSTWTLHQTLPATSDFTSFGAGVWLSGRGLAIADGGYCDTGCYFGRWFLYTRRGETFAPVFDSYPRAGGTPIGRHSRRQLRFREPRLRRSLYAGSRTRQHPDGLEHRHLSANRPSRRDNDLSRR